MSLFRNIKNWVIPSLVNKYIIFITILILSCNPESKSKNDIDEFNLSMLNEISSLPDSAFSIRNTFLSGNISFSEWEMNTSVQDVQFCINYSPIPIKYESLSFIEKDLYFYAADIASGNYDGFILGIKKFDTNDYRSFYILLENNIIKNEKIEEKKEPKQNEAPLRNLKIVTTLPDIKYFGIGSFTKEIKTSLNPSLIKMICPSFNGKIKEFLFDEIKINLKYPSNTPEFYSEIEFIE